MCNDACRTGFARRLSKRLKHLPPSTAVPEPRKSSTISRRPVTASEKLPVLPEQTIIHKETVPPDSAYSSLKDKDSPPNEPLPTTPGRRESYLGPLPFEKPPLPPVDSTRPSESSDKKTERTAASVRSLTSSKSRSLSVRNLFRNKWKREEKILPA